jgi:hypothetical protein
MKRRFMAVSHENPSKDTDFHPSMYEVMIHGGVS